MDEPGRMQDVSIERVAQIVKSLQLVVAKFYGPQCFQTLLTSQTGQAVITSDGLTILDTLQPAHPIAVIVANSIKNCLKLTQDGCKVFLLYLSTTLDNLVHHIFQSDFSHSGTNTSASREICMKVGSMASARSLQRFKQSVLPNILDKIYMQSSSLYTELRKTKSIRDILEDVCKTTLAAHFNPKQCDHLSDLLIRFVGAELCSREYHKHLRFIVGHFGTLCIKVPNKPYTESQILPAILINRDFAVKCDDTLTSKHLKILLLRSSISGNEEDGANSISLNVRNSSTLTKTIEQRKVVAEAFVGRCSNMQIDLVLCTESIPGYMLDMFRRQNISVVTYIQGEDMELIEQLTSKLSHDFYDPITEQTIFTAECVKRIGVGGRVYLHIQLEQSGVNQLILCAPTRGSCDQTASVLLKALSCMMLCFCSRIDGEQNTDEEIGINLDKITIESQKKLSTVEFESKNKRSKVEIGSQKKLSEIEIESPKELSAVEIQLQKAPSSFQCTINDIFEETEELKMLESATETSDSQQGHKSNYHNIESIDVKHCQGKSSNDYQDINNTYEFNGVHKADNSNYGDKVEDRLFVIEGGGGFEVLLSHLLQEFCKDSKNEGVSLMCKILDESLLNVVRILYENLAVSSSSREFMEVRQELKDRVIKGSLWGLSRRGNTCDVKNRGVLESVECKVHIFTCVINLLQQLLHVDGIVGVRKLDHNND